MKSWALLTLALLLVFPKLSYQVQGDNCHNVQGDGTHVSLNAVCYGNGTVQYEWDILREQNLLGILSICYTCSTPEGNTSNWLFESPVEGERFLSLAPSESCVFGGCYVYSAAAAGFPTLAIPQTPCTAAVDLLPSNPSTALSRTSSQLHVLVETSVIIQSSTRTTLATTIPSMSPTTDDMSNQPSTDANELGIFLAVPVSIFAVVLLVVVALVVTLGLWIRRHSKRQRRYSFKKNINRQISQKSYDDSEADPVTPDTPTFQFTFTPSLYNLLDPKDAQTTLNVEHVESEGTVSGYVTEEGLSLANWGEYPTGISRTMSPAFSDQSGYIVY